MPRLSRILGLLSLTLAVACNPQPDTDDAAQEDAPDAASSSPPITQQQVEDARTRMVDALRSGNGASTADLYDSDAMFVSARGKFEGRDAITAFWTDALKAGAGQSLQAPVVKWGASGDLAYSISRFTGGVTASSGHTLMVYQRQADGTLKVLAQFSVPDAATQR
jgi:ketosteroid isomerase-like protein